MSRPSVLRQPWSMPSPDTNTALPPEREKSPSPPRHAAPSARRFAASAPCVAATGAATGAAQSATSDSAGPRVAADSAVTIEHAATPARPRAAARGPGPTLAPASARVHSAVSAPATAAAGYERSACAAAGEPRVPPVPDVAPATPLLGEPPTPVLPVPGCSPAVAAHPRLAVAPAIRAHASTVTRALRIERFMESFRRKERRSSLPCAISAGDGHLGLCPRVEIPLHWAVQPPSTGSTVPVTSPAASDAR
jgi:hypothetical protein